MNDGSIYEYVLDEVDSGNIVKKLWAKAIINAEGNPEKTKSLYMRNRVECLKEEFDSLGIDYASLDLESTTKYIENLFINEEWRKMKIAEQDAAEQDAAEQEKIKTIKAEKAQQEKEAEENKKLAELEAEQKQYRKIGGWLLPFAIILGFWVFIAVLQTLNTITVQMDEVIKPLLLNGHLDIVRILDYEFYIQVVYLFLVLLLAIFFYKKLKGTKEVAVIFFISIFLLNLVDNILASLIPSIYFSNSLVDSVIKVMFVFFFSLFSILYFLKSKRVEKTFTKVRYQIPDIKDVKIVKSNVDLFIYAMTLPLILLMMYENLKPNL